MKKEIYNDFPETSTQEWISKIKEDLRGSDYNKKLVWKTNENIDVEPFYRLEDLDDLKHLTQSVPGQFPYFRGGKTESGSWRITQEINDNNSARANKSALESISGGADSLIFSEKIINSQKKMNSVLSGINPEEIQINFSTSTDSIRILEYFLNFLGERKADIRKVSGSLFYDPHKIMILNGHHHNNKYIETYKKNSDLVKNSLSNFNLLTVHSYPFKSSGANIVQELAFTISSAVEYMVNLSDSKIDTDYICNHLLFSFSVSSNYFMEIAKLRAARVLWSELSGQLNTSKDSVRSMKIHCHSANFNKTVFDPYVNILRETAESMAAAIGGADSIQIDPFDKFYKNPDSFSRRISRNIQNIIKSESYLDKVIDPASGSYYIEKLTDSISTECLNLIIDIEKTGGFTRALEKGLIQQQVRENSTNYKSRTEIRKEAILGTNIYPDIKERLLEVNPDFTPQKKQIPDNSDTEPLEMYRASEEFEKLRLANEQRLKNTGKNIRVFLFKIGNPARRSARANFSLNFFGCAGFEIIDNPGFESIDQGIEEVEKSNPDIVVICSSDQEYPDTAPEIISKLKGANSEFKFIIAGYPADHIDDLVAAGVDDFVHMGSNTLEILNKYQNLIK